MLTGRLGNAGSKAFSEIGVTSRCNIIQSTEDGKAIKTRQRIGTEWYLINFQELSMITVINGFSELSS